MIRPPTLLAWGGEGHQLIGWIAEERLGEKAKAELHELLGDANLSDAEFVNWADVVRRERRETAPWHYVNIPLEVKGYDPERDGRGGNNVIVKIQEFQKILADASVPREQRIEALKFLVHFVGDLHQPLHCADRNGDKGGNGRLVFFLARKKAVNLHQVWDSLILGESKVRTSIADYGDLLNAQITAKQADEWRAGTPEQWANESLRIARERVYAGVPPDGAPPALDREYVDRSATVVNEQIEKAGVRLAEILNTTFR